MKTIIQKTETLDNLIYHLPKMILSIIISIRLLVAIPLVIVSIHKFSFIGNNFVQYFVGIGSIIIIECSLILTSLLTAHFRKHISELWANGILIFSIILTVYTGILIQSLNQVYDIELPLTVFITLHLLNVISIIFSESIGFLLKKADEVVMQPENTTIATEKVADTTIELPKVADDTTKQLPDGILQQLKLARTNKEKVLLVKDILSQKEIVEILAIDKSQVSRYCKINS